MRRVLIVAIIAVLAAPSLRGQSGSDLFQKALSKERAEGQLDEAIQIYAQIVKEFAADRPLVAKALLQMARGYERLGKDDARKTYERLVREYADQRPVADEARDRLAQLSRAPTPITSSMRLVWSGAGVDTQGTPSPDGRYLSYVDHGDNTNGHLAIRDVSSGQTRRLTQGDSPDRPRSRVVYRNPVASRWAPARLHGRQAGGRSLGDRALPAARASPYAHGAPMTSAFAHSVRRELRRTRATGDRSQVES